ncbi:MAG: oxygenase MpaB family protein [Hyphomonadaceae bacterium]
MVSPLRDLMAPPPGMAAIDFTSPQGAAALVSPHSVSWRVFKNPVSLFIGGAAAVILELAEPRVRTGVWEHTSFRADPVGRMRRTGYAAMATIYAPTEAAEAMIAAVNAGHARIRGQTPAGESFSAADTDLLVWVHATAAFGFLSAYRRFVRRLSQEERDRFYAEGMRAAALYGAIGAPRSEGACAELFTRTIPTLEKSEIVFEFLDILAKAPIAPTPLAGMQKLLVKAAVALVPVRIREILELGRDWDLPLGAETVIHAAGAAADRFVLKDAPPAQACVRMGLKADYLYR